MEILFVILFLLSSELVHSVAIDQQQGYNPYPFGTWIFCMLLHILLLTSAIFYLGWMWGIILFCAHFFGVLNFTVTWVLNIPILFVKKPSQLHQLLRLKLNLLFPFLLINLAFTVASFLVSDFKLLFYELSETPYSLVVMLCIAVVFSIPRLIIMKLTARVS